MTAPERVDKTLLRHQCERRRKTYIISTITIATKPLVFATNSTVDFWRRKPSTKQFSFLPRDALYCKARYCHSNPVRLSVFLPICLSACL